MDQLRDLADSRLISGCVYCDGGLEETRDHVPSRILLDPPYPDNLPVVPACYMCNNGFSRDEEYLACLLECVLAGSTSPDAVRRPQVATILRRSHKLRSRIEAARSIVDGRFVFAIEKERIENVIRKLAVGHAAYELSSVFTQPPTSLAWWPLPLMTAEQREAFEAPHVVQLFGEIGSRGMQRCLVTQVTLRSPTGDLITQDLLFNDWIDVQEDRYRYLAIDDVDGARVRIVLAEYLACEVFWSDNELAGDDTEFG